MFWGYVLGHYWFVIVVVYGTLLEMVVLSWRMVSIGDIVRAFEIFDVVLIDCN